MILCRVWMSPEEEAMIDVGFGNGLENLIQLVNTFIP